MLYLGKVLKAFILKPHVLSTREAVVASCQVKLSTLVKAVWCYDVLFLRSNKLQTQGHTHMEYKYWENMRMA